MADSREIVVTGAWLRIHTASALLLALSVAACLGGQTTVPGNLVAECHETDAGDLAAQVLGSHAYDVSWQRTRDGVVTDVSATRVTLDIELASDISLGVLKCFGSVPVTVQLSSDDGMVEFSGTGSLARAAQLQLRLDVSPLVLSGSIDFADTLMILLNEHDGPTVTAHGAPVP